MGANHCYIGCRGERGEGGQKMWDSGYQDPNFAKSADKAGICQAGVGGGQLLLCLPCVAYLMYAGGGQKIWDPGSQDPNFLQLC